MFAFSGLWAMLISKIQDEEFGAMIFSSITVHNVYHEGEALRGNGVEGWCV